MSLATPITSPAANAAVGVQPMRTTMVILLVLASLACALPAATAAEPVGGVSMTTSSDDPCRVVVQSESPYVAVEDCSS